jgi:hypothetical protein
MDIATFLTNLLRGYDPEMIGVTVTAIPVTKYIVSLIRKVWLVTAQGNVIQTLAAGVALVVVTVLASSTTILADNTWRERILAVLVASIISWMGAIGFNEILANANANGKKTSK